MPKVLKLPKRKVGRPLQDAFALMFFVDSRRSGSLNAFCKTNSVGTLTKQSLRRRYTAARRRLAPYGRNAIPGLIIANSPEEELEKLLQDSLRISGLE